MTLRRDPISELFDGGARHLLGRAYRAPGAWQTTRLEHPDAAQAAWAAAVYQINVYGRDYVPSRRARTRWARAFTTSLYYQHNYWSDAGGGWRDAPRLARRRDLALVVDVQRSMPARGIIPAGRQVRIRVMPGGAAARAAVARLPLSQRIFGPDGEHAGASSQIDDRPWPANDLTGAGRAVIRDSRFATRGAPVMGGAGQLGEVLGQPGTGGHVFGQHGAAAAQQLDRDHVGGAQPHVGAELLARLDLNPGQQRPSSFRNFPSPYPHQPRRARFRARGLWFTARA